MQVCIEFYGVPRLRAGVAEVMFEFDTQDISLNQLLQRVAAQFPDMAAECFDRREDGSFQLLQAYAANLDGEQFVRDPTTRVSDGQAVLFIATDAGG